MLEVLLIDDDDFVRMAVTRQLQSLGIRRLTSVADGREALQRLETAGAYRLIISDLCLPGVDGIELVRKIAERQPQAALVLISSREHKLLSAAADLARERGVHVLGSLEKPVTRGNLRALLAQLETPQRAAPERSQDAAVGVDDLCAALDRDELSICVQPKIALADGSLLGVEVLARWNSPHHGFISPDCFIRLAESSGQIQRLTETVLDKSLQACRDWQRAGVRTTIAVNFSAAELYRLNLPDLIGARLESHGLASSQLIVEVTETAMVENPLQALDVLTRLRLHGIGLAIDDFGCGYSTLKMLRRVPFTELKLDRSFVFAAVSDGDSRSIVRNSIELAHQLGLKAVAEGVETPEHQQLVAELGCDAAQGYWIARPFPPDHLAAWCAERALRVRPPIA